MGIEKEKFRRYHLEKKSDTFTVRMNKDERKWLEEIKEMLNVASDSKALKISARVGLKVLHGTFGKDFCKYLFKKERVKLEDFKHF